MKQNYPVLSSLNSYKSPFQALHPPKKWLAICPRCRMVIFIQQNILVGVCDMAFIKYYQERPSVGMGVKLFDLMKLIVNYFFFNFPVSGAAVL